MYVKRATEPTRGKTLDPNHEIRGDQRDSLWGLSSSID